MQYNTKFGAKFVSAYAHFFGFFTALVVVFMAIFLSSCSRDRHDGIVIKDEDVARIFEGISAKSDVRSVLGAPSFILPEVKNPLQNSGKGSRKIQPEVLPETWYYLSVDKKIVAFLDPKVTQIKSVVITFDGNIVADASYKNSGQNSGGTLEKPGRKK